MGWSAQVRDKTMHRQYVAANPWAREGSRTRSAKSLAQGWQNQHGARRAREYARREGRETALPKVRRGGGELTLVRVRLFTGRSHQIRVQLSHAGLPIWGDARYGGGRPGEQIALWGAHLGLIHPTKKEEMHFDALPPMDAQPWKTV